VVGHHSTTAVNIVDCRDDSLYCYVLSTCAELTIDSRKMRHVTSVDIETNKLTVRLPRL